MLLQIHDELVFEAPPDELKRLAALVSEEMTTPLEKELGLRTPLRWTLAAGPNWLDVEEISCQLSVVSCQWRVNSCEGEEFNAAQPRTNGQRTTDNGQRTTDEIGHRSGRRHRRRQEPDAAERSPGAAPA